MRAAVAIVAALALLPAGRAAAASGPASLVDPFNGTRAGAADFGTGGGAGNTFPGATRPFGMVQLSPDTAPGVDAFGGGYSYVDRRIKGFGVKHMSGPGCAAYGDVPIMPTTAAIAGPVVGPGSTDLVPRLRAGFAHADESAAPGDYRVRLATGIETELTATQRTGVMRLRFPAGRPAGVLVNAGGAANGTGAVRVTVRPGAREIAGSATSGNFCYAGNTYPLFFAARFDRPFEAFGTWKGQDTRAGRATVEDHVGRPVVATPIAGADNARKGTGTTAQAGGYATFDTRRHRTVEVRVGVSFVSVAGARANLRRETRGASFAALRARARTAWDRLLSRIRIGGGRRADRRTFFTQLYHALLHPSLFSDADGRSRGFDDRIRRLRGRAQYADYSGWDTYRTQMPLVAMLAPRRASAMVASLLADARQSGGALPKWPQANGHTHMMVGDPADLLIAGAYAFGARRFDADAALRTMVRGATDYRRATTKPEYFQRPGLPELRRLGYVPFELNTDSVLQTFQPERVWGTASTSLEYALADFGIAQLAGARCRTATARRFTRRAGLWRRSFDPAVRGVRPRDADGRFRDQPARDEEGFVEGNGAQYTLFVPHDAGGLFRALGGLGAARARLDRFFARLNAGPAAPHAFLGNEPTLLTPWLLSWAGEPYRAQAVVRRALLRLYADTPAGMPGNDDLGSMSSWWVFGALGLSPAVPGTDVLAVGSPLFRRATVRLAHGTLRIRAPRAARGAPYVRALRFRGRPVRRAAIRFRALRRGGTLRYALSRRPTPRFGRGTRAPSPAPPSC